MGTRKKKNSTLRNYDSATEVARRASVSKMTVSRVFSGLDYVSEETRKKVLRAANEIGYHPNTTARALRTGRSGLVGFLTESVQSLRGEFHTEAFAAFESIMSAHGLNVMISITPQDQNISHLAKYQVATSRCEAIAIRYDILSSKDYEELAALNAPVVLMNFNPQLMTDDSKIGSVGFDNQQGIEQAVRYLASLGHQHIAYLGGTPGWLDSVIRKQGFLNGMKEAGLTVNKKWVEDCDFRQGYDTGTKGMRQIFARGIPGLTAVVCASDEIAVGAMNAATHWGKSIPKDFSVIGFDDTEWSSFIAPPLTTIRHRGWDLGEKAGKYLLEIINKPDTPRKNVILETQLIIRESTGVAPLE